MKHLLLTLGLATVLATTAHAEGIPEPGIVLYGEVRNVNALFTSRPRMTFGALEWPVQAGGKTLQLRVGLTNIPGNLSYRVRIPFESVVGGNTEGAASFVLNASTVDYRSGVDRIVYRSGSNSVPAVIQSFSGSSVLSMAVYRLNTATRGMIQRVDFAINTLAIPPLRGAAAPNVAVFPEVPADSESVQAGVVSGLQFTAVGAHPEGGVFLQWTGAPVSKGFYLLRAEMLEDGLGNYAIVKWFQKGASSEGSYHDTTADSQGTYFYRLWAE